jgi:archaellum biogenesis ATPase FlaH
MTPRIIDRETYSKFGVDFQEKLVQIIFEERSFCDQIMEVMDVKFFELEYLRVFLIKLEEYRQKYKSHPTIETMHSILLSECSEGNEAVNKQLSDYFFSFSSRQIIDRDFIKDASLDFAKKQDLKKAMLKCVPLIGTSSFDEISKILNASLSLGLDTNFGYDYLRDFEMRYEVKSRNPVSTGWTEVDRITQGGLAGGELGVVIGSSGGGKSMILVHLGAAALREGKNVIFYTLELSDRAIGKRFDSCITGIPINELASHKEEVYKKLNEMNLGQLIIKKYPAKTASSQTLKNHLEKIKKRGVGVDIILIDYADRMKPITVSKEAKRFELEEIYEDLRGIAEGYNVPLFTASQCNRSGAQAELITQEAISEAYNKVFPCDFIFTCTRTKEEKLAKVGRFYIAKNRFGYDGQIFPCKFDPDSVKIEVFPIKIEDAPKAEKEKKANVAKLQKEALFRAYQLTKTDKERPN